MKLCRHLMSYIGAGQEPKQHQWQVPYSEVILAFFQSSRVSPIFSESLKMLLSGKRTIDWFLQAGNKENPSV